MGWISPTGFVDPYVHWLGETLAYDENEGTYAYYYTGIPAGDWFSAIDLTHAELTCDKIRYMTYSDVSFPKWVIVNIYYSGGWHVVDEGHLAPHQTWKEISFSAQAITAVRFLIRNIAAGSSVAWLYEVDFGEVTVVAPTVTTQAASNIDATSATLNGEITDTGGENCDERGFESRHTPSVQTTLGVGAPHGAVYYDGFVYTCHRLTPGKVVKTSATNYASKSTLTPQHNSTDAGMLEDIIYAAGYLWTCDTDGWVYKIDPTSFTVSAAYQPVAEIADSLCSDGTYIYVGYAEGHIGKILISTGDTSSNDLGNQRWHALVEDGDYLYGNDIINYDLHKIAKSDLTSVDNVSIGMCTDDVAQDSTYVYLGREGEAFGLVRVTKSDLSLSVTSPSGIGMSYGVFMVGSQIILLDAGNNWIWVFESDLSGKKAPLSGLDDESVLSELAEDGNGNFHIAQWKATDAPLIKINKYVILDAFDWTETDSYGTGTFDHVVADLHTSVTYKYRAKAHNSAGWGYGDEVEFITNKDCTGSDTGSGVEGTPTETASYSRDETGSGADAKATGNPLATMNRSETGSGAEGLPARGLFAAQSGSGVEASTEEAAYSRDETGGGVDGHKAVAPQSAGEAGSGVDAKATGNPLAAYSRSETGSGVDAFTGNRGFILPETGSGVEHILDRAMVLISESGSGLDTILALLGKKTGDTGTCVLENSYLHVIEGIKTSSDTGSGVDASVLAALFQRDETGEGVETVIARALFAKEYPTGAIDLAKVLTATITGTGETGTGADVSLASFYQKKADSGSGVDSSTLEALFSRDDVGAGAEAITLLAAMLASDVGQSVDTVLNYLRTVVDSGTGAEIVQLIGAVGRRMRMKAYPQATFNLKVYTSEVGR